MTLQYRPTKVQIDLAALRHNVGVVKSLIPPSCQIVGVIKANAYGHGAVMVARTLNSCGVRKLAVASVEEGLELSESGIRSEIMVLEGLLGADMTLFRDHSLTPVIHNEADLVAVIAQLKEKDANLKVHFKFDTGMGRLGFVAEQIPELIKKVKWSAGMNLDSLLTHLALADGGDAALTQAQCAKLDQIAAAFAEQGLAVPTHFANSAAICDRLVKEDQWVRPGIMLYGSYPAPRFQTDISLQPVMRFKTKLLDIRRHPAGVGISYGHTFTTQRESLIGLLPVGYADGYPRSLSNKGVVFINGQKAPIVGRVCMDLTMVDLTDMPEAKLGDDVELWGENLSVDEIAGLAGTISYELLCGVSKRVPRIYQNV